MRFVNIPSSTLLDLCDVELEKIVQPCKKLLPVIKMTVSGWPRNESAVSYFQQVGAMVGRTLIHP